MIAAVVASLLLWGVWAQERRNRPVDVAAAVAVAARGLVKAARILTGSTR